MNTGGFSSSEKEDFDEFLRKVDELETVVKGECKVSSDHVPRTSSNGDAPTAAVRFENKQAVDRTVINKDAFNSTPSTHPGGLVGPGSGSEPMDLSQDGFMRAVERDAADRAQRREEKKRTATEWKDKGNEEFRAGNYEKAVEHYTEGLIHLKDFGVLYTNRAQAYNKLGKFQEAMEDCDLILRLEPENSKAHIHRGKALLGVRRYEEAADSYRQILAYDPKKTKMVDEYVADAEQARIAAEAEGEARTRLAGGDAQSETLSGVLEKLWRSNQNLMYYAGGMRVLADMLQTDTTRTLFRTGNGFNLLRQEPIRSCLSRVAGKERRAEEEEVVHALLDVLLQAVTENDENCRLLLEGAEFPTTLQSLLCSGQPDICNGCVALLLRVTGSPVGRRQAVSRFDGARLIVGLLAFIRTSRTRSSEAAKVLNNLALEKKFISQLRHKGVDDVLPAFEELLTHSDLSRKSDILPPCISFMGNMTHDQLVRRQIANRREFWEAANTLLKSQIKLLSQQTALEVVYTMLGLLMNVTMETTQALKDQSEALCTQIILLLKSGKTEIEERATGLLARMLPHSLQAVTEACLAGIPDRLLQALRTPDVDVESRSAYCRCLAVFTKSSEEARRRVVEADPNLGCFLSLLCTTNPAVVANVALSVGHCLDEAGVTERLADTDVVKTLLARTDTTDDTVKQNCAVTLAKLATSDQRHLERLRELGGIGILHSCSKYALG